MRQICKYLWADGLAETQNEIAYTSKEEIAMKSTILLMSLCAFGIMLSSSTQALDSCAADSETGCYSLTCNTWASSGFASKDECIKDGRWHLVYQNDESGNAVGGSLEALKTYVMMGAEVRNADAGGTHFCETIGWPSDANSPVVCFDGMRVAGSIFLNSYSLNDGNIALGAGARRTDGKRIASNLLPTSTAADAPPKSQVLMIDGGMAFSWFVRF